MGNTLARQKNILNIFLFYQCCGSGTGIQYFLLFWPRNPGWKQSGQGYEIRDKHPAWYFQELCKIFGLKIVIFFVNPVLRIPIRDLVPLFTPGSGIEKSGSRIWDLHPGSSPLVLATGFVWETGQLKLRCYVRHGFISVVVLDLVFLWLLSEDELRQEGFAVIVWGSISSLCLKKVPMSGCCVDETY